MSKYGMLGLLEGVGRGMVGMGQTMTKNSLLDAQDKREANRERLRQEQRDKTYALNRADQKADQKTALANRPPSAFKEKNDYLDKQLADEKITLEQYNTRMGYSRKTELTKKERVKMVNGLRSDYENDMGLVQEKERIGFKQWAKAQRPESFSLLYDTAKEDQQPPQPPPTKNPTDSQIDQLFGSLMKTDPSTWDAEISAMHDKGYPEASKKLRKKVQAERKKLKKSEDSYYANQEAKERSSRYSNDPARNPKGLLEGGAVSTLH